MLIGGWHLFESWIQQIILFSHDTVICGIKLTELTSFDFDYNGAVAPRAMALGGTYHFFVPNAALIQGGC